MFCKYCGQNLPEKSVFCSNCGKRLVEEKTITLNNTLTAFPKKKTTKYIPTESSKSRLIAALLAFFFGDLGAHRFYVGKFFTAFIQMVLGLSFLISLLLLAIEDFEGAVIMYLAGIIWGFWTLIDFLMILCGVFRDSKGFPLTDWEL